MKKLLVLVVALLLTFTLTGCEEETPHYDPSGLEAQLAEDFDEVAALIATLELEIADLEARETLNNDKIVELTTLIDELEANQLEPFIVEMLRFSFDFQRLELSETFNGTVEAYGWSETFVFEVEPGVEYRLVVWVDNDLELNYYDMDSLDIYEDLVEHAGNVPFTVEFTSSETYLFVDLESWDEFIDSNFYVVLYEVSE